MKFSKNLALFLVVDAIVLAVFNAIAWVIPFPRGGSFWTGYGFASFAIVLAAAVAVYAFGREGLKSKFYGVPMAYVTLPYLVVQVLLGLIQMAIPAIPYRYGILLDAILLAAVLIGLIGAEMGRGTVEDLGAKVRGKVFYIKSLQGEVEALAAGSADAALSKDLKALAEALRFSDPMSAPQLAAVENQIEAKVAALGGAVGSDAAAARALCAELQGLVAERNRKCKLLK
jgi:hypothetical protein